MKPARQLSWSLKKETWHSGIRPLKIRWEGGPVTNVLVLQAVGPEFNPQSPHKIKKKLNKARSDILTYWADSVVANLTQAKVFWEEGISPEKLSS